MEKIKILKWLKAEHGSGYGFGDGYGYGYGSGDGSGSGSGSGFGDGSGSGSGSGDGIKSFGDHDIYYVDGIATVITSIIKNLARGFILETDFTLTPCYVAKGNGYFAHGKTIDEARDALQAKIFENMDTDEAIEKFVNTFKKDILYLGSEFFIWHHYLTGSCEMGRKSFIESKGLSLDAVYTVNEFIDICEGAYGGDIIKKLKEYY